MNGVPSDDAKQAPVELPPGGEPEPPSVPAAAVAPSALPSTPASGSADPISASSPTDRPLRLFELLLVCVIAFGGSILYSLSRLANGGPGSPGSGSLRWIQTGLHEVAGLALVWYVLRRRARSFSHLGFSWARRDLGWSILLWLAGWFIVCFAYAVMYFSGLTATHHAAATARVGYSLYGGTVSSLAVFYAFLNPFYEELIVRAYVMTEVRQLTNRAWAAVLVSTILQTSYHFYQGAPLAFAEGTVFLVFSLYYAKTNRIMPIILAHLYMDVGSTFLYWLR